MRRPARRYLHNCAGVRFKRENRAIRRF